MVWVWARRNDAVVARARQLDACSVALRMLRSKRMINFLMGQFEKSRERFPPRALRAPRRKVAPPSKRGDGRFGPVSRLMTGGGHGRCGCGASGPYGDMKDDGGARWTCLWSGRGSKVGLRRAALGRDGDLNHLAPVGVPGRNRGSASDGLGHGADAELTGGGEAAGGRPLRPAPWTDGEPASRKTRGDGSAARVCPARPRVTVREGGTRRDQRHQTDQTDQTDQRRESARHVACFV